jgi:Fe-S cluster biogenesis protein NfuA
MKNTIVDKIITAIDSLRSYLQEEGGDMQFVSYDCKSKSCTIKILGACADCPYNGDTFDLGIKNIILAEVPEVKEVDFI